MDGTVLAVMVVRALNVMFFEPYPSMKVAVAGIAIVGHFLR